MHPPSSKAGSSLSWLGLIGQTRFSTVDPSMLKVLLCKSPLLVLMSSIVCTDVNPSLAQEQDRRIQAVMRCQMVEERFTLGRDLGAKTGFKMGGGSQLPPVVRQRLEVAAMRAIDQVFSWNVVEQDYIKVYAEVYNTDQLDFLLELCQEPRYQQLMLLEVQMIKDTLAVNEKYAPKIQEAALKAVQDVLQ